MKKGTILLFGLVVLFLIGLYFIPAEGGGGKNIELRAIFRDLAPGEGTMGDKIRSDGNGIYTHGVDGVQCCITPSGELNFYVDSPKRNVVVELGEGQRAKDPFHPLDPSTYPTDYYSGPIGDFEFRTENSVYVNYPINLLQMGPESIQWGAAVFRCMPTVWGKDRYFLRFYNPGFNEDLLCKNSGCDILVTAHDSNGDGQIESWDFEPILDLGEYTNVAYVYRYYNRVRTCFGWFYIPFKLTVERLK